MQEGGTVKATTETMLGSPVRKSPFHPSRMGKAPEGATQGSMASYGKTSPVLQVTNQPLVTSSSPQMNTLDHTENASLPLMTGNVHMQLGKKADEEDASGACSGHV